MPTKWTTKKKAPKKPNPKKIKTKEGTKTIDWTKTKKKWSYM